MINFKSKNIVLLTGAGFTKNFGGFLGSEMWAQIFNDFEIQNCIKLRNLLQENYDFESVYSTVINGKYDENDKDIIKRVVERAYRNLDDVTKDWVFNNESPHPVNWYGWGEFINLFSGTGTEKGLFFTLNQDIFLERKSGFRCPGVPIFNNLGYDFSSKDFVTLPTEDAIEKTEKDFLSCAGLIYIKLHGSYGWKSSDGSNQMVIGKNKSVLIEKEPILKWYFDLFKNTIYEGGKKLVIIGYGFNDQHINEILVEGVKNHDLQIYIINPEPVTNLRKHFELEGHYYALPILSGLRGYFPNSLEDIFPKNQDLTQFKKIKEVLTRKNV